MTDFKVGDKVRTTDALAEEARNYYGAGNFPVEGLDAAIIEQKTLVIFDDDGDGLWPLWVREAENPVEGEDTCLSPDELELVLD